MVDPNPLKARRGRPRTASLKENGPVRVELRLSAELAQTLFVAAQESGRTVSAVGQSGLIYGLAQEKESRC